MTNKGLQHSISLWTGLLMTLFVHSTLCNSPPTVTGWPPANFITKDEDFTISKPLFNFTVDDIDKDVVEVTMDPETKTYISLSSSKGPSPLHVMVKLKHTLDWEVMPNIPLTFTVSDSASNSYNKKVTIFVGDVNDNAPVFRNLPYTWDIEENAVVGKVVYTSISATDPDGGQYGTVRFQMQPVTQSAERRNEYSSTFSIDNINGIVKLSTPLDYETNNYYQFSVLATDGGGLNTTTPLIIRVKDVQDSHPFFDRSIYQASLEEELKIGTAVITVHAIDGDRGIPNEILYSITNGACKDMFTVDSKGTIKTNMRIDRDGPPFNNSGTCKLGITATEKNTSHAPQYGTITNTTTVYITVTDINDNGPTFTGINGNKASVQASTPENSAENSPVPVTIHVQDIDQGNNAIINMKTVMAYGECEAFKVVPDTIYGDGTVAVAVKNSTCLDYETVKNISFKIIATDDKNGSLTAELNVVVNITDVNDNNPAFGNIKKTYTIDENSKNGTHVATITATDRDTVSQGHLVYSISGGNERFHVDKTTGEIQTHCSHNCSTEFDRERYSDFTMSYIVNDEGERSDLFSLTIKLADLNDNTPHFYRSTYTAFIDENDGKYNTTPVITLDAADKDATGSNNHMTYSILTTVGIDSDNITINGTSGKIFLKLAVDFEGLSPSTGSIRLTVQVEDNGNSSLSSTASAVITVQDQNDNKPIFTQSTFTAKVYENETSTPESKKNVTSVTALDKDGTKRNSDFHYFINGGAFEQFAINSSTGEVTVQIDATLDREKLPNYNITLNAIDQGSPAFTSTATLQITVLDVNDEAPVFNKTLYTANIAENSKTETSVKIVGAYDPDENCKLHFSIVNVTANDENGLKVDYDKIKNYFSINSTSGDVLVNSTLDREAAKLVTLKLMVKDTSGFQNTPQTATSVLEITIDDVNDNFPVISGKPYNIKVPENAPDPDIIGHVTASDKDENRTITYVLVTISPSSSSFSIDNKTGQVIKNGKIDRETVDRYAINVSATDNGVPPKASFVTVNVTVTDVNDNPPVFNMTTSTIYVYENRLVDDNVIKINATDKDSGKNKDITYAISSGSSGNFKINTTTGLISVSKKLDWETIPSYSLIITAKDNPKDNTTQKSSSTTLNIIINDVNDNPPVFEKSYYELSRPENTKPGTAIVTMKATDNDKPNTENSTVSYKFLSSCEYFEIDSNSGVVNVSSVLKDHVGNYTITVQASDHGSPNLVSNATLQIHVTDVNYHKPVIGNIPPKNRQNEIEMDIYECIEPYKIFWSFNYSDEDHGQNAEADFNITGVGDNIMESIQIYPNGSLIAKKELHENIQNMFKIQVTATDKGIPPLSSAPVHFTLRVLDVNDNPPEFTNDTITTSIYENQRDKHVATVEAFDIDSNSTSCYRILEMKGVENSTWNDFFNISKDTGEIYNIQPFDYEVNKGITLVANVTDCSLTVNSGDQCDNTSKIVASRKPNITIDLTIKDVNDNPPRFVSRTVSTGMRRTEEPGSALKLQLKDQKLVNDKDSLPNGFQSWHFANDGEIISSNNLKGINTTSGIRPCGNQTTYIICIEANGTINNNKYFSEDLYGYFLVPVIVYDKGGNDTSIVKIDLIGDSQILVMTILDTKEIVSTVKDQLLIAYSNLLGQTFVYDGLEDHKEGDTVYSGRSDLFFHVRDKDEENVMSAKDAELLIDKKANKLTDIQRQFHIATIKILGEKSLSTSNAELKFYVLLGIVAVLTLTLILVIVASMVTRNTYRRKVKAVTVQDTALDMIDGSMNIPGSNHFSKQANPLLNTNVEKMEAKYDTISHKSDDSLDSNVVGNQREETLYDNMEEREVTMDMYTDDRYLSRPVEDPLDAALRLHELSKSFESLDVDNHSFREEEEDEDEEEAVMQFKFENYAFDDMEATEI